MIFLPFDTMARAGMAGDTKYMWGFVDKSRERASIDEVQKP